MSARSRYLDAISPKSNTSENNEFSTQSNRPKPSINTTNNSGVSVNRGQQQQIISPSNLLGRNRTNNSFNSSNNYTNNNTNSTNNNTNSTNNNTTASNISTRNKLLASAPPPPPPPGPPPKRVGSNSRSQRTSATTTTTTTNNNVNNRPVIKYTGDPSVDNNNESSNVPHQNNSAPPSAQQPIEESYSPAKKGGSIWSPKNEVQSGSVKSMTMKLWGSSKVNNSPKVRSIYCVVDCVVIRWSMFRDTRGYMEL